MPLTAESQGDPSPVKSQPLQHSKYLGVPDQAKAPPQVFSDSDSDFVLSMPSPVRRRKHGREKILRYEYEI